MTSLGTYFEHFWCLDLTQRSFVYISCGGVFFAGGVVVVVVLLLVLFCCWCCYWCLLFCFRCSYYYYYLSVNLVFKLVKQIWPRSIFKRSKQSHNNNRTYIEICWDRTLALLFTIRPLEYKSVTKDQLKKKTWIVSMPNLSKTAYNCIEVKYLSFCMYLPITYLPNMIKLIYVPTTFYIYVLIYIITR